MHFEVIGNGPEGNLIGVAGPKLAQAPAVPNPMQRVGGAARATMKPTRAGRGGWATAVRVALWFDHPTHSGEST